MKSCLKCKYSGLALVHIEQLHEFVIVLACKNKIVNKHTERSFSIISNPIVAMKCKYYEEE